MEPHQSEKKILKPSVIHDDFPQASATASPQHARPVQDDMLPENPERNYHHDETIATSNHQAIQRADDDEWNGEDA